ncbi:MAG: (2Fe-2S)-binding protein [Candidatus Polarisedimenticolaceae bacterium]|nr:(2Fe-2S)-binding protein [Candidatus Polarisedimenticolaceae bacterium]
MISLQVNGSLYELDADPDMPLLWALRDLLNLTGTKYSCGIAQCGACTVHIDGRAAQACITPLSHVVGKTITTIEGLAENPGHPVLLAWQQMNVPQCGHCQPGQIMATSALLDEKPNPTDTEIEQALDGNICRCGTYPRIRQAIRRATQLKQGVES